MEFANLNDLKEFQLNLSEEVVTRKNSDGSIILMKMDDGDIFYKMEGVSSEIYKRLEAGKSLFDVSNEILDEYDVSEETLVADLSKLMNDLTKVGLISSN